MESVTNTTHLFTLFLDLQKCFSIFYIVIDRVNSTVMIIKLIMLMTTPMLVALENIDFHGMIKEKGNLLRSCRSSD